MNRPVDDKKWLADLEEVRRGLESWTRLEKLWNNGMETINRKYGKEEKENDTSRKGDS